MQAAQIVIGVVLIIATARVGVACSRMEPVPAPATLVQRSNVVVLGRATPHRLADEVEFEVVSTLKGTGLTPVIVLEGSLTDHDDFNESPVPYTFVRRDGRHGNCFAKTYRAGALYLLLLNKTKELVPFPGRSLSAPYTPYWEALAPTNEQVQGAADRWVRWVRDRLSSR
jgi:hypothetical protein